MKVGFSRLTVTAPLGTVINGYGKARISDGVLDDTTITALAFSDGERMAVAVTMDILEMVRADCDRLRSMISERHGIDKDAILLHSIHAHTSPEISGVMFERSEEYRDYFFKRVTDAAGFAIADLKDSKISIATGEAKEVSFVRRYVLDDGRVISYPWFEEDRKHIVLVDGTPDESVQLVKIEREGAHDIAIVNFQMHPDCMGGNKFSADFVHFTRLTLEQALVDEADGKGVKVAYFNGSLGDTTCGNPNITRKPSYAVVRHLGRRIAAGVLRVYTYTEPVSDDKVTFKQVDVHIPRGNEKDIDRDLRVSAICFGEVGFIGLPGEPYTEIGRCLKRDCAFRMTIPTCNTNDWMGYLPMRETYKYGGYGINPNRNRDTADLLIDAAVRMSKEITNKN